MADALLVGTAAVKDAFLAGFQSGFMVAVLLLFVGWMWKTWCERGPR